jgi:RNA-binding protein
MNAKQIKELRASAKTLEPVLRIGKNGITDSLIVELKKHLKKKKLIKIKILKSARGMADKKAFVNEIAQKTESELVELIGYVFVLYKKN